MTEMNRNTEELDIPWIGFGVSLISAPALISIALLGPLIVLDATYHNDDIRGLMGLLIPLCIIGTLFYLIIGTPVLIWHLSNHAPVVRKIVGLSVLSVLAMLPVGGLISLVTFDTSALLIAALCTGFGLIGAPVLAFIFTLIYQKFTPA
jgi:hypothetical protein